MNAFMRRILDLPDQASSFALDVDQLHYFIIIATLLGSAVFGLAAVYFAVRYRRGANVAPVAKIKASPLVEAAWITFLLTLFIAWWLMGYRLYVHMQTPPKDAMEVYVIGKQWMWKFAYPDGRSSISVLTVPVHRPVRLNMTSRDVIHSFSVPAFRIKQDVLPGRYTTTWFEAIKPGTYQILCAEYCGVSHSRMWGRVVVLSAADFEAWQDGQLPAPEESADALAAAERTETLAPPLMRGLATGATPSMIELGRRVAVKHGCFACHTIDGRRHIGPTWLGLYDKIVQLEDGAEVRADASYLTESMMDPRAKVVRSFDPVMPTFQGLLTAAEVGALIEFIKSLKTGEPKGVFPGRPLDNLRAPPDLKAGS
jgi:cytochrome c oxidase subunit 2